MLAVLLLIDIELTGRILYLSRLGEMNHLQFIKPSDSQGRLLVL